MSSILTILATVFAFVPFAEAQRTATSVDKIRLPEGFEIELLYSVPRDDQGSWVAMCQDNKGRLIDAWLKATPLARDQH